MLEKKLTCGFTCEHYLCGRTKANSAGDSAFLHHSKGNVRSVHLILKLFGSPSQEICHEGSMHSRRLEPKPDIDHKKIALTYLSSHTLFTFHLFPHLSVCATTTAAVMRMRHCCMRSIARIIVRGECYLVPGTHEQIRPNMWWYDVFSLPTKQK